MEIEMIPWKQRKNDYFRNYMRDYWKIMIKCEICNKEIAKPAFNRHLKESVKHQKLLKKIL